MTYLKKALPVFLFAVLPFCFSGCRTCGGLFGIDDCAEIEEGAVPALAGTKICDWQTAQVSKALQDQTTIYLSDFVDTSATLSPAAAMKINRSVHSGLEAQPWIVEPSGNTELDSMRTTRVTQQLESLGVSNPVVVVDYPQAIGLPGPFAEAAAGNSTNSNFNSNSNSFGNSSNFGGFGR